MATKLENMKLNSVDLVRAGANQEADIMLFKSDNPEAQQKLGGFNDALTKAVQSIREDENLDEETRQDLLQETWEQFCAAVAEALGFELEEDLEQEPEQELEDQVKVEKEPELEEIEELQKYNHNHGPDGRFAPSGGGGGGLSAKQKKRLDHIMNGSSAFGYNSLDRAKSGAKQQANEHRSTVGIFDLGKRKSAGRYYNADHKDSTVLRAAGHKPVATVYADALSPGDRRALNAKVNKTDPSIDTIIEVEKFNPFHDALGRFASKNGFKTYSANPKMRAAQPSIIRSAQAGHGHTMNVHRESKGENVGQNYDWLQTGKKPAGVGTSSGGTAKPKQQSPQQTTAQSTATKPKKPKQQKPQDSEADAVLDTKKPKADQSIEEAVANVSLSSGYKLALQARDNDNGEACDTRKVAEDHDGTLIKGSDISGKFNYYETEIGQGRKSSNGVEEFAAIDAVAIAQGWDKGRPTVISDRDTFDKLCLQNECVLIRSVHDNSTATAAEVANITMTRNDTSLGAGEGTAYGGGLYMVNTHINPTWTPRSMGHAVANGQAESYWYGPTQMMATLRPGAKIADYNTTTRLETEFNNLPWGERGKFGGDVGAYIAAKGYDGAKWHGDHNPGAYSTIYNKTALVFFSEVAENH